MEIQFFPIPLNLSTFLKLKNILMSGADEHQLPTFLSYIKNNYCIKIKIELCEENLILSSLNILIYLLIFIMKTFSGNQISTDSTNSIHFVRI